MELISIDGYMAAFLFLRLAVSVVFILYLVNLQKTLQEVSFHNRELEPGLVWLNLIPVFNIVWTFIVNIKISNSLQKELEQRQGPSDYDNYARIIGIIHPCSLILTTLFIVIKDPFPYAGKIAQLAYMVCVAIHWYQTAGYKRQIREMGENLNVKNDLLDGF